MNHLSITRFRSCALLLAAGAVGCGSASAPTESGSVTAGFSGSGEQVGPDESKPEKGEAPAPTPDGQCRTVTVSEFYGTCGSADTNAVGLEVCRGAVARLIEGPKACERGGFDAVFECCAAPPAPPPPPQCEVVQLSSVFGQCFDEKPNADVLDKACSGRGVFSKIVSTAQCDGRNNQGPYDALIECCGTAAPPPTCESGVIEPGGLDADQRALCWPVEELKKQAEVACGARRLVEVQVEQSDVCPQGNAVRASYDCCD